MKIIQRLKVKFRKLRGNKVEDLEQRRRPDLIYEGFPQVIEERDSLKDQLSEANRKIAELENMARAFQAQESLNHQLSNGKKEEDDGKVIKRYFEFHSTRLLMRFVSFSCRKMMDMRIPDTNCSTNHFKEI
ncbi:hypothetical protein OIU79_029296 [Salix purpurea]|uniref:Uncharacterized protein n=1 Tax=Salix purpurea TaxID=77065 RepID=A0A9Q0ZVA5_SALPP|nr:hypothetical protein OIU79_029296 [Salix purpurea]